MNPHTQQKLRMAALAIFTIGVWLAVVAFIPSAVEQRLRSEEATSKPSVDALRARDAADAVNRAQDTGDGDKPVLGANKAFQEDLSDSPTWNNPQDGDWGRATVTVTAFSSHECETAWCKANEGKPAGKRVALSRAYNYLGTTCRVALYPWDDPRAEPQVYDVVGFSDALTDVDIWFGDDYAGALAFGRQTMRADFVTGCPNT